MNPGDSAVRVKKIRDHFKKVGWYKLGFRIFGNHSHEKDTHVWNKKSMMITQIWECNRELFDWIQDHPKEYHPKFTREELNKSIGKKTTDPFFTLEETHSEAVQIKNMDNTAATAADVLEEICELFDVRFSAKILMRKLRKEMKKHKNK